MSSTTSIGKGADSSVKQHGGANVGKDPAQPSCPKEEKLDPRVRRTRKLLEDAWRALMAEKEFNDISVADIADRATVNRATFYAHFEDKEHLAATVLQGDLERILLERLAPPAAFAPDNLTRVVAATLEFMARCSGKCPKSSQMFSSGAGLVIEQTLEQFFLRWFEHEPDSKHRFPRTTPETMANALAWATYGAAVRWSRLPKRPDAERAARETVEIFFR